MTPMLIHRFVFSLGDAVDALIGGESHDIRGVRIEDDELVIDVAAPALAPTIGEIAHQPQTDTKPARKGGALARRAGIICDERSFQVFVEVNSAEEAKQYLYRTCGIASRADLDHEPAAAAKFKTIAADYDLWMQAVD